VPPWYTSVGGARKRCHHLTGRRDRLPSIVAAEHTQGLVEGSVGANASHAGVPAVLETQPAQRHCIATPAGRRPHPDFTTVRRADGQIDAAGQEGDQVRFLIIVVIADVQHPGADESVIAVLGTGTRGCRTARQQGAGGRDTAAGRPAKQAPAACPRDSRKLNRFICHEALSKGMHHLCRTGRGRVNQSHG
jgi:hypothetical protein